MEALLEYRQTDVCYGGVRAVRGVSFTLHAGEILGRAAAANPPCSGPPWACWAPGAW